jgi:hypothetical protein
VSLGGRIRFAIPIVKILAALGDTPDNFSVGKAGAQSGLAAASG